MRRFFVGFAILAIAVQSPQLAFAGDQQIAEQIVQRLETEKSKGSLRDFNIGLRVEEGAVYLSGYVANRTQEKLALDAARKTAGVQQVFNEMELAARKIVAKKQATPLPKPAKSESTKSAEPANFTPQAEASDKTAKSPAKPQAKSPAKPPTDRSLTVATPASKANPASNVKPASKVKLNPLSAIKPRPSAATATRKDASKSVWGKLNLVAKSAMGTEKGQVVKTAELQSGGKKTSVVPASTSQEDAMAEAKQIATAIIEKLSVEKQRGNLRKFGIDVEVDHGVVWLKGHVSYPEHQELALDIARRVAGVTEVVNDLKIKENAAGNPSREDDQVAQEIVQILQTRKQSGELRGFGIDVQVEQGAVWLSGYVADAHQQHLVLEAARRVQGVREVVNDMTISAPVTQPTEARSSQARPSQPQGYLPVQYTNGGGSQTPLAFAPAHPANHQASAPGTTPVPMMGAASGVGIAPARYDHPQMPGYAWPSYASYPNYGAVTYPRQYSASAWPYIGPFYPYPQVPLGWRKVTLEWDDGWWHLDFKDRQHR